jgi:hypothetical protein
VKNCAFDGARRVFATLKVDPKKLSIRDYPAGSNRKVWTGFRQSIPSSM